MLTRLLGKITVWKTIFVFILGAGLYATYVRFFHGLGASTNLTDEFPWGLWIGFDVLVGVGLAAGGFVIAATVHIFHIEKYESIARPSILTAFLGYSLVVVALMFDIGRPYRLWHPLIMWNPRSVMFEVGWCVTLYTTVLAAEFSPLIFERFKMKVPLKIVRAIYVPLVIVGVLLSTLHQSSLGTLYVIAPDKLHALWYSPMLPVFFFISAIAAGLAMTIFESFMSYRAFGKRLEADLLEGLARVIVVTLALYLVWRFLDLKGRGGLPYLLLITPETVLFWGEMVLGVILPMIFFATPKFRQKEHILFFAAMLTILGFVINRLNVAITGMAASSGVNYMPSWMELAVTASIVAGGFVLFALAVKHLPIFPEEGETKPKALVPRTHPAFHGGVVLTFWILLLIGVVGVGYAVKKNDIRPERTLTVSDEAGVLSKEVVDSLRLPAAFTFPTSDSSLGPVTFRHDTHLGKNANCAACHRALFRLSAKGIPLQGELTEERIHQGNLCGSCHNGTIAFSAEEDCDLCHKE